MIWNGVELDLNVEDWLGTKVAPVEAKELELGEPIPAMAVGDEVEEDSDELVSDEPLIHKSEEPVSIITLKS